MDRFRLLYPRLTWTEDEYRIAEQIAREGNCWAQYEMARYIMGNRSIPEDTWRLSEEDAQSYLFWLKHAASGGLPWAQYWLARELGDAENRYGVYNPEQAFRWMLLAATLTDAQYALAGYYLAGFGTEQNIPQGLEWLEKAADAGHPDAIYTLAFCYEHGVYYLQSQEMAIRLYLLLAKGDDQMPRMYQKFLDRIIK